MRQRWHGIFLPGIALSFLILLQTLSWGGEATLSWDPNTEPDLAGYKIYHGVSPRTGNCPPGGYPNSVDVGKVSTYTLSNLTDGQTHYFSLTAYDTSGNESCFSAEVSKTMTDTIPPVISGIASGNITHTGATITWTTNEAATSQVEYGTATAYGSLSTLNSTPVTNHSRTLSGLAPSTTYHYRVLNRDAAGNLALSGDNIFTTAPAPDTTAPSISGITSGAITSSGATISWTTNEPSDTQIHYGTTTAYGSTTSRNISLVTSHSQSLTGLSPSTLYHFRVLSRDAAGNLALSGDNTLTTAPVLDTTAPSISGIISSNVTSSGAVITWVTNEAATSQVEYGTTNSYGSLSSFDATLVTGHSQTLGNLISPTTYHYRIISKDAAGNTAVSGDQTFTTSSAPDTTPPAISNIGANNITHTGTTITWSTNEAATTQVEYGQTASYGSFSPLSSTLVTGHNQPLTDLAPSTLYHFSVLSRDAAGNLAVSGDDTFVTAASPDTSGPIISGIAAGNITADSATLTWNTNEPATTEVEYGATTAYGNITAKNAMLLVSHTQTLLGLQPNTLYHYRVRSADDKGNLSVSADQTLVTSAAPEPSDTIPPRDVEGFSATGEDRKIALSWINPSDSDFVGVRIRFRTDHFPDGIDDGELLGDFTGRPNENVSATHEELQNGVTYYYIASSYDGQGNFQTTARASATPSTSSSDSDDTQSSASAGGCGMIDPRGGKPPGPGQAADMIAIVGTILFLLIKKRVRSQATDLQPAAPFRTVHMTIFCCPRWGAIRKRSPFIEIVLDIFPVFKSKLGYEDGIEVALSPIQNSIHF